MDTNALISHARARFDHAAARRVIREKYESKMLFGYRGGMWKAGPELLTLLESIPVDDDVVILDLYQNPIKINPPELKYLVFERWQEQMNAWLVESQELDSRR